ncbi:hypothetical protein GDO81_026038 [Engystomops pustulosus]|uniref:Uncharacterized protein n=1 Tax=Engystomops pustulosus TaxID=76066 RepID=A0AAV6Z1I7_ENGPU|nr:hypothetical protein GDO81_026038 [Engystomops pustulosus]
MPELQPLLGQLSPGITIVPMTLDLSPLELPKPPPNSDCMEVNCCDLSGTEHSGFLSVRVQPRVRGHQDELCDQYAPEYGMAVGDHSKAPSCRISQGIRKTSAEYP